MLKKIALISTLIAAASPTIAMADIDVRARTAFNSADISGAKTNCAKAMLVANIARTLHDAQEHYLVRQAMILAIDSYFARYPMEESREWYVATIDGVAMSYDIKTPSCS